MISPSRRSRIVMSLLSLALAASASTAVAAGKTKTGSVQQGSSQTKPHGYNKKAAIAEADARFALLHDSLAVQFKDKPELEGYLRNVTDARAKFKERAASFLPDSKQPIYRSREFDTMAELVEVTITQLRKQVALQQRALATGMSATTLAVETKKLGAAGTLAGVQVLQKASFLPMLPDPAEHAAPNSGQIIDTTPDLAPEKGAAGGTVGGAVVPHVEPSSKKPSQEQIWAKMTDAERNAFFDRPGRNSKIVILGVESTKCAIAPKDCAADPLPNPGTPSTPNNPDPPFPGSGSGASSGSTTNESVISDIINTIATTGGTNAMASQSVIALQHGDFARAAQLAQNTLSFDPANRSAMEVLQSVKGRGDAMDAGDASLSAAKGGASAFGVPGGPEGSSGLSSGIATAALSGAAKVASDEARAGATNALKLGDPNGALGILSKALAENPNNPALLNLRAQTYGRLGRWDDALKDAVSGLALAPGNMVLLNTKALSENRSRRWRDALATADMMIAADPKNAWAYANRAHAWGGLGDRDAMLADINRAAALEPRFKKAAADAALTQIPSDSDVMFLFPGESAKGAKKAPAPAGRGKSFSVVVGAGILGGLLLALGLLSTVLAPLKDTVVSAFTRVKRTAPVTNTAVATAQPASAAGNVGGLIRGQYEISRQIGAGGMGMVYEGTDRSLGRRVAIKKMREELRVNARERDRFIIEAKTVASLHHPNIVDIYAIAEEGEDVYLVFEYVDGKTVHDLVQTAGRLAPAESVRVTRAMGDALTYAHAHGVIHRDMKPSNVMVTAAGQVKVMDFGIARMAKDAMTRYSMTNTVVGTPPYMAPEQEQGVVRKESDVYSLAICAYEMLTGKLPFIGMGAGMLMNKINMSYIPPSRNIAGLPEALDEVFLKAFQADPDRRYRTPQEFVTALAAATDGARSGTGSA